MAATIIIIIVDLCVVIGLMYYGLKSHDIAAQEQEQQRSATEPQKKSDGS
jgi:vacuolar-type H+-ATPase subunit F/Vma7